MAEVWQKKLSLRSVPTFLSVFCNGSQEELADGSETLVKYEYVRFQALRESFRWPALSIKEDKPGTKAW